jgi:hypothetical protein
MDHVVLLWSIWSSWNNTLKALQMKGFTSVSVLSAQMILGHEKIRNIVLIFCSSFIWQDDIQTINNRTRNVTLRRVRVTDVAVEKQYVLHIMSVCVCSPRYPACNAHALYFYQWPARLYCILSYDLINGTIFINKNYCWQNVCFYILYKIVWNISHSKKNWASYWMLNWRYI